MASETLDFIINEHILAEWVDTETATHCTLGSCSLFNRSQTDLFIKVGIQPQTGDACIYISLIIDVLVGTRSRKKEIRMIFLPSTFNKDMEIPLPFETLQIFDLTRSSVLKQADLTNTGHIIRAQFNLSSQGHLVTRKSNKPIKPTTSTCLDHIHGLRSLSTALNFNIYMRQSDYAKSGLQKLNQQLRNPNIGPSYVNLVDLFEKGRDAMFINWDNVEGNGQHQTSQGKPLPPPQLPLYAKVSPPSSSKAPIPQLPQPHIGPQAAHFYAEQFSTSSGRVDVPQSPPNAGRKETLHQVVEIVLAETPHPTLNPDSPIAPTASQTSALNIWDEVEAAHEEGEETGPDDEFYAALQAREASLDREAAAFVVDGPDTIGEGMENEVGSDEEDYAREFSIAREFASTSETLLAEVTTWVTGAMTINKDVHNHVRLKPRLLALGYHARLRDTKSLHITLIWCSTIFFCDPHDSGIPELWSDKNRWLVSDMAELIKWSNTFYRSPEICISHIRAEFMKLGSAAQAISNLASDESLDKHTRQRARCVAVVLREFGTPGIGREKRG